MKKFSSKSDESNDVALSVASGVSEEANANVHSPSDGGIVGLWEFMLLGGAGHNYIGVKTGKLPNKRTNK